MASTVYRLSDDLSRDDQLLEMVAYRLSNGLSLIKELTGVDGNDRLPSCDAGRHNIIRLVPVRGWGRSYFETGLSYWLSFAITVCRTNVCSCYHESPFSCLPRLQFVINIDLHHRTKGICNLVGDRVGDCSNGQRAACSYFNPNHIKTTSICVIKPVIILCIVIWAF